MGYGTDALWDLCCRFNNIQRSKSQIHLFFPTTFSSNRSLFIFHSEWLHSAASCAVTHNVKSTPKTCYVEWTRVVGTCRNSDISFHFAGGEVSMKPRRSTLKTYIWFIKIYPWIFSCVKFLVSRMHQNMIWIGSIPNQFWCMITWLLHLPYSNTFGGPPNPESHSFYAISFGNFTRASAIMLSF